MVTPFIIRICITGFLLVGHRFGSLGLVQECCKVFGHGTCAVRTTLTRRASFLLQSFQLFKFGLQNCGWFLLVSGACLLQLFGQVAFCHLDVFGISLSKGWRSLGTGTLHIRFWLFGLAAGATSLWVASFLHNGFGLDFVLLHFMGRSCFNLGILHLLLFLLLLTSLRLALLAGRLWRWLPIDALGWNLRFLGSLFGHGGR